MKLVSTTLFLIFIAASLAFSLPEQSNRSADEKNYHEVSGFSGYLTLDDEPREKIQRWLDPVEIETLSAMPTMKRVKTMGAFVELRGCQLNAQGVCNTRVKYTIYKPDGSILATREVGGRALIWKKPARPLHRRSSPKPTRSSNKPVPSRQSKALAPMYFKLLKDDPVGEYQVKAEVTDHNANISFDLELNFYLR